jgi:hypothetical protein
MGEVYKARDTRLDRTVAINCSSPFGRQTPKEALKEYLGGHSRNTWNPMQSELWQC